MKRVLKIFKSYDELGAQLAEDAMRNKLIYGSSTLRVADMALESPDEEIHYRVTSQLTPTSYVGDQGFDEIEGLDKFMDRKTYQAMGILLRGKS